GENGAEVGMNPDIALVLIGSRQNQQSLLQHPEENVICLRPRASEFVVNERVAFPARRRQAMVGPFAGGVLLVFQNSMDETVDDLAVLKPELAADQIGGRHLLVTSEKHHRPPQLGRHMK